MSDSRQPRITERTGESLIRRAYEFEQLAARFRAAGYAEHAAALRAIAHSLSQLGRDIYERNDNAKD